MTMIISDTDHVLYIFLKGHSSNISVGDFNNHNESDNGMFTSDL